MASRVSDRLVDEVKDYAASDPEAAYIAAGYPYPLRATGSNLVGLCPFHSETDGSFTIGLPGGRYAGKYKCFGCREQGDIINFYQGLNRGSDFVATVKALADAFGIPDDDDPHRRRSTSRPRQQARPKPPPTTPPDTPPPIPDEVVTTCQERLYSPRYSEYLQWLTETKCLPLGVVWTARIGLLDEGRYPPVYTIPIPALDTSADGSEVWVNIRRYSPPGAPTPAGQKRNPRYKMMPWSSGRGTQVYPWVWVRRMQGPLIWCEGEIDCLQLLARDIKALTSTGGAGAGYSLRMPDLSGQKVFVLGDNDAAGASMPDALRARLYERGAAEVWALRWPATLPNGEATPRGADPSDLFNTCPALSDPRAFQQWLYSAMKGGNR